MLSEVITAVQAWEQNPNLHRLDDPRLLDKEGQLKSGSHWTWQHVNAFRIVPVLDRPLSEVLPTHYFPDQHDPIMAQCQAFWKLTRDDLYNQNVDPLSTINTPMNILIRIGSCMDALMGIIDRRRSHDSDLSHTSEEADTETELATNAFARTICRTFLQLTGLHHKTRPSWDYVSRHESMPIRILRSIDGNVRNDGAIIYIDQQRRKTIHIWIETKPYDHSPVKTMAYEKTIPQKVAESISLAQNQSMCEIFGIEFSHRYAAFWSVVFTEDYITKTQNNPILDSTHPMVMKRSKVFDLVEQNDRRDFAQAFIGLLRYKDDKLSK